MREIIKYSVSAILLSGAFALIYFQNYNKNNYESEQISTVPQNKFQIAELTEFDNYFDILPSQERVDNEDQIYSIFLITTQSCFSCINNVDEYAKLIQENEYFADPILIFVEEDTKHVENFLASVSLDLPFNVLRASQVDPFILENKQNLLFVDKKTQKVFKNTLVLTVITKTEYKSDIISEAIEVWKNQILNETHETTN